MSLDFEYETDYTKVVNFAGRTNNVKGLCTVTFGDSFVVRNVSIVESKKGGTFVSMPSFKTKTVDDEGNPIFKDIAFPITKEFCEELYA